MSESKRERSKAYPQYALGDMVEALRRIHSQLGAGPYSRAAIAEGLGHSAGSGSANSKAAALVHFGLLDRQQNAYHLSPIARQLLHPTDEGEVPVAIAEAVKIPTLFAALFERFADKSLPQLLPNILTRDYGIISKQSNQASELFRQSVEYAGLLRNGVLHQRLSMDASGSNESQSPAPVRESPRVDGLGQSSTNPTSVVPNRVGKSSDSLSYPIPLSGGRVCVLELPRPVTTKDLAKITGWLDLMADVLTEPAVPGGDRQGVDKENPEAI